jgi:hypothetical protein
MKRRRRITSAAAPAAGLDASLRAWQPVGEGPPRPGGNMIPQTLLGHVDEVIE